MKPIVTVTMNPAVDISADAEAIVPTQKIRCRDVRRDPGGGGINVARDVHALGGPCIAAYAAGGVPGDNLQRLLRAEGVPEERIPIDGDTRESLSVREQATGQQFRFVLPGPTLSEAAWEDCLATVSNLDCQFVVASGSLPPGVPSDFYARLARVVRQRGRRLLLDTSGPALAEALEEGVYAVKPNLREIADWATTDVADTASQLALSRQIIADGGAKVVALTLGADGALLTWKDGYERLEPPKVDLKSAVGAGDSFMGGFVLGLAQGWSLARAFRLATAAGSAALLTPGTELCRRGDVDRLYQELCQPPRGRSDLFEPDTFDLEKALLDPVSVFQHPKDVVASPSLSRSQKIEILHRWAYDARELEVAEEENMPGGEEDLLSSVLDALAALGASIDVEHVAPTKEGGA